MRTRLEMSQVAPGVHHARTRYAAWVLLQDGTDVTVVDSGWPGDRRRLLASLERIGRSGGDVAALLLTHGHRDHVGSAAWLHDRHGVPVRAHVDELAHVRGERTEEISKRRVAGKLGRRGAPLWVLSIALPLGGFRVDHVREVSTFTDGVLDVPGRPVAIPTPGHTSGHVSFHLPDQGVLLAGDALVTKQPWERDERLRPQLLDPDFNHDHPAAVRSLNHLRPLEASVVLCGHGAPFRGTPAQAVAQALDLEAHR
jgi:glyoxylase-like metal-dependent hydrolase (beta-lactamase superfamily II)